VVWDRSKNAWRAWVRCLSGEHHLGFVDDAPQADQPFTDRVRRHLADVGEGGQPTPDQFQPFGW
jgi:hypothetical protein